MIHVFGVLLNSKINKVMARKKKVEEEQPVTAEVVETKKKSSKKAPKTKMSAQKESIQETGVQEPIVKEENTKDSFKDKDYTIDELIDMLGPDIDCEDDTEFSLTENTSSQEGIHNRGYAFRIGRVNR